MTTTAYIDAPVRPYITLDEFRRAPMSLDTSNFLPDDTPDPDVDAEMRRVILRASGAVNNHCNQPLYAATLTESGRVPVTPDGFLAIATRRWPVRQVLAVRAGPGPNSLVDLDISGAELDPWRIRIPAPFARGGPRPYAVWTYTAGWPVTTLVDPVAVGATSIKVVDATGVTAGETVLTVAGGPSTETVVPTAVVGNTLTVPALTFAHDPGAGVSSLPDDVRSAVLLFIESDLRFNDSYSITVERSDRSIGPEDDQRQSMRDTAKELLNPYRRVI